LQATAVENVGGGRDFIDINGKPLHIISYLNNFLFDAARLRTPVWRLSGGEQNRLILAKLFSQPANLLVLDEPTNDLDLETLELLEELLCDFEGTVLLVSHDRSFVDNVVTSTVVFEGNGVINEFVGGYSDWQNAVASAAKKPAASASSAAQKPAAPAANPTKAAAGKLSYKLQRELQELPEKIEHLESEIAALTAQTQEPAFYSQTHQQTRAVLDELSAKQVQLDARYARWAELDNT
jgi:ATP-binding cassette subfamily F protein uup